MKTIVFLLEEESAKVFLQGFIPRICNNEYEFIYISFEGKQDLLKQLPRKLRYWQKPDSQFVIIIDQDMDDCQRLKSRIRDICESSGKSKALIRIACRELESWYLGDLDSVRKVYDLDSIGKLKKKRRYRNPDIIQNPDKELQKITNNLYQKVSGSRNFGLILSETNNKSKSFQVFCTAIIKL
jgi:hypothetical protein